MILGKMILLGYLSKKLGLSKTIIISGASPEVEEILM